LWDLEPEFDIDNPAAAMAALQKAESVVAVSVFATESLRQVASVILPLAPLAESEGSLVNLDGDSIPYAPAGKVQGDARPGWKILRRLGDELGLEGFGQVSLAELQTEMQAEIYAAEKSRSAMPEADTGWTASDQASSGGLYRIGEVPMYSVDPLCRRAGALQKTVHAESRFVGLNPSDATRLGLTDGGKARVSQETGYAELEVRVSDRVPPGAAWVRSATCSSREMGSATRPIQVEVA